MSTSKTFESIDQVFVAGFAREQHSSNLLMVNKVVLWDKFSPAKSRVHWSVDVFTPDLNQVSKGKPEKMEFPEGGPVEEGNIVSLGGVPKMLFFDYKGKEKKVTVYSAAFEQGGKLGSLQRVGSLEGISKNNATPMCIYAADSTYLLIICAPVQKDPGEKVSFLMLNRAWKITEHGELNFPVLEKECRLGKPIVCQDESIWMPVWEQAPENDIVQSVWAWKTPKSLPTQINITLSTEELITSMVLQSSNTGVYVGGLYAETGKKEKKMLFTDTDMYEKDYSPEQGTFFAKIDIHSHIVLSKTFHPFSAENLKFWGKTSKNSGISWLETRSIIPLPDGSVWVDVEEAQVPPIMQGPRGVYSSSTGPIYGPIVEKAQVPPIMQDPRGVYSSGTGPIYGPIIAVWHAADGKETKEIRVNKSTKSQRRRHISHFFEVNPKGILFLYNDHKRNLDQEGNHVYHLLSCVVNYEYGRVLIKPKTACAASYFIGNDVKSKPEVAFNIAETDYWLEPNTYLRIAPGVYVFACEGRNVYGLFKVEM